MIHKVLGDFILLLLFFGCVGSSLLCTHGLSLVAASRGYSFFFFWGGATLHGSARASHCGGFSCCGARALGAQASVVVARGL